MRLDTRPTMKCVLFVVDTLRADHLGCYGYPRDTSPRIDELARISTVFERCYASDVPTIPSFTSTFTGQRGIVNGVVSHARHEAIAEDAPWLPSHLESNAHTTAAVSTLYHMRPYFARGYRHYMNPVAGSPELVQRATADQIDSLALPWIREHADEDFFLFVHYWDVHEYSAPEQYRRLFYEGEETDPANQSLNGARASEVWPFLERKLERIREGVTDAEFVRAQYDSALRYVDDRIGQVFTAMEDLGLADDVLLIVTSDHGESLGEHSIYFDHASVYEDTVRVPLIIRWPGCRGRGVKALVQNIDLAPTVLEVAGIQIPPQMQGRNLVPLLEGRAQAHREEAYINQGAWQAKRALIADRLKYTRCIHHGFWPCPAEELYDLSDDPQELNELSGRLPQVLDEMALKLRRWEEAQLGRRIDPLVVAAERGLTPIAWVWELVKEKEKDYGKWAERMGWQSSRLSCPR